MTERQKFFMEAVDAHKQEIEDAGWWLWKHPQVGYTEWEAHNYLKEKFEALGYKLVFAGNIPGFYTDIETGKPGPKLCLIGELDALDIATHPESVNGMAHCCGHCAQGASLLALAEAFKTPGALDGLSGSIRLMMVPAEEMIQLGFREELRKKGEIRFFGGKPEFMARGLFDGVDLAMMVHANNREGCDFVGLKGQNGCLAKNFTYKGKASHAGGAPEKGINAQYAAMLGLQACNDLRETFVEKDQIRFHPIMKGVSCAVNIIPDEMPLESFVRGKKQDAIDRENAKINRALAGAAAAMGAKLTISDRPGYSPTNDDKEMMKIVLDACEEAFGEGSVLYAKHFFATGSSDFGSLTSVMPGVHLYCNGFTGTAHGIDYHIPDMFRLAGNSAKAMLLAAEALLSNGAAEAKRIVENYKPEFASIKEYVEAMEAKCRDIEAVVYNEDGTITLNV